MSSAPLPSCRSQQIFTLIFVLFLLAMAGCAPKIDKAAWVVRYNIASPAGVDRVCQEAKKAGIDSLMVQVRGRGDAYYQSTFVPPAERLGGQPPDFDPLARALVTCAPVPIHAWLNVYYLWGGQEHPEHPFHPAQPRFGWILQDHDGRSLSDYSSLERALGWVEGIYADPASTDYRKLFTKVVSEVVNRYPVAGVHLDFVRYPGAAYGHGGKLGERFASLWGLDPRWLPATILPEDLKAWLTGEMLLADRLLTTAALLWAETRATQVTALVRAVHEELVKSGRTLTLSAAVFPEAGSAYLHKGQDWRTWAEQGLVDALYPMAYFGGQERVAGQLRSIRACRSGSVKLWAGLGAYIKQPAEIGKEAAQARQLDYDGICLFDLGSLLEKPAGAVPYVRAIAGHRPLLGQPEQARVTSAAAMPFAAKSEVLMLKLILAKALAGRLPEQPDLEILLAKRWSEFAAAQPLFQIILARLRNEPPLAPGWVELRGIFRYLDPLDGSQKRCTQLGKCLTARQLLANGRDFAEVAEKMSQGGSKKFGGILKRLWLAEDEPENRLLAALLPGDLSPVVEVANGFWCYQVLKKGSPKRLPLAQIPWPARRVLFRTELRKALPADSPEPILDMAGL